MTGTVEDRKMILEWAFTNITSGPKNSMVANGIRRCLGYSFFFARTEGVRFHSALIGSRVSLVTRSNHFILACSQEVWRGKQTLLLVITTQSLNLTSSTVTPPLCYWDSILPLHHPFLCIRRNENVFQFPTQPTEGGQKHWLSVTFLFCPQAVAQMIVYDSQSSPR